MPIGSVPSAPNMKFNSMRRINQNTPQGPAIRRMSNTVPAAGQISHWSLVRDGANLTQEYYGISEGKARTRGRERLIEVMNNDTHDVMTTVKIKRGSIIYVVNKDTGNIVEVSNPTKKQSYISRFNVDTFPRTRATEYDITEVGFWTVFGNYWPPVKFSDHLDRKDLDREVGGLLHDLPKPGVPGTEEQNQDGSGGNASQDQQQHEDSPKEVDAVSVAEDNRPEDFKISDPSIDQSIRSQIHIETFTPPPDDSE